LWQIVKNENYQMIPRNFPEVHEVIKSIERLKLKVFPTYRDDLDVDSFVKEITNMLFEEFGFILNAKQPMKCDRSYFDFYRVRPVDGFKNINLIREHSYPPLDIVKMGRCNFPNYPVFYCSTNAGTSLLEVARNSKEVSKEYCISKWTLIKSEEEIFFESFLQIPLPAENYFGKLKDNFSERINASFKLSLDSDLSNEQIEGIMEYLKFLDNCFMNDKDYSLSASLAHRTLYANHNCRSDMLMYPSLQSMFKGVNLALNPNFVENNLKLTRLYIVNLIEFNSDEGLFNISISEYAEVEKNVMMWKKIQPENKVYMHLIQEDFGEIVNSEFRKNNNLPQQQV
jgi:hypothetical protein